jgi:hypothetical protein
MDGTGSGSHTTADFGINGVEPSGSINRNSYYFAAATPSHADDTVVLILDSPKFPIQHLAASKSGVCITNSRVHGSYVAVVLIRFVLLP